MLACLLAGLLLVVVELMTGTFYLLILGVAAGVGSVVAYFDQPFWMQALLAAIAAYLGAVLVPRYHRVANATSPAQSANDIGETVGMEKWISEPQHLARVRYRDTPWDAQVLGAGQLKPNALLYVVATQGSRLTVSAILPSEPPRNNAGAPS
jgi:membrane protein implicated in regulation of membrane protease activity